MRAKKAKRNLQVLLWFPQVGKTVVQGESDKNYVVDYVHQTCMCEDHQRRHHACKHIRHVLEKLMGVTPWEMPGPNQP
jgi:hypothetical protein